MKKISMILILILSITCVFACVPDNIGVPNDNINNKSLPKPLINVYYNGELITLDNPLDFEEVLVGKVKELTIVIANEGKSALYSPKIAICKGDKNFDVDPITLRSIPAGSKIKHKIRLKPDTYKMYKAVVRISGIFYDYTTDPPQIMEYETFFETIGKGVYKPILNVYHKDELITVENPYDFGQVVVNQTKKAVLTIKNEGNTSLYSPKLIALSTAEFKLPVLGIKSIAPGNSIDIVISYTPADEGEDQIKPLVIGYYYPNNVGGITSEKYSTQFKCIGYGVYVY